MDAPEVDVPDPEDIKDRFSRSVAILIVVGTLAGAVVGFLQTQSGRRADASSVEAQRLATQAMGQLLRSQQVAQVDFETFALADQQGRRAASARQGFIFLTGDFEKVQDLEQDRWEQLAEQTRTLTKINQDSPDGPVLDPSFPGQFFAKAVREAVRLRALQDAANESDGAWSGKESTYTAILTVFAVSLYLLGLSLTVQVGVRRLFSGLGLSLIMIGAVWAVALALSSPVDSPPEAAEAFADGHVKHQAASTPAQYEAAVKDFDRAIALRPTFARAYQERGEAEFSAGASQGQGLLSVTRPENLAASTRDFEKALELGLETPTVVGNLGFHRFLQGLAEGDGNLLEEGLEFTARAAEMDPKNPIYPFNRGVTLLALGRVEEARAAYQDGIRLTIYSDPSKQTLLEEPATEEFYVAGAITDLEILARAKPDMAAEVQSLKELIVGSDTLNKVGTGETALSVPDDTIKIEVFPSEVQWTAFLPGYDADTDEVSQQWYYQAPDKLGWAALPSVSGVYAPRVETDEGYFQLNSYLASTFPPSCLSTGTFRVELYANGKLVGRAEKEEELPDLRAYVPSDLNAALCRPSDWVRSDKIINGWVDGYVSPEGDRGVYVLRYSPPRPDATFDLLDGSIDIFSNFFPSKPTVDTGEGTDTDFFLGLKEPRKRWYNYPNGYVRAGAGLADDGSVIVALVFGPTDIFDEAGDLALQIFDSFIEFEPVTP
jgi:tetratricopeptide (TPR) repeat protein